jgi:hypothetical protein
MAGQEYPTPQDREVDTTEVIHQGTLDAPAPRPGEKDLWDWLENMSVESEKVRREECKFELFHRWMDMYYGTHWQDSTPSYKPPVVINELRTLILSEANDLSESMLRMYIQKDPRLGGRDKEAERAMRAIWSREQVDLKLLFAVCWALILGTGFLRVQWDPNGFKGLGDVIVDDIDPRFILPDPDAIDDRRWSFVIVEQPMDLMEIRRLFPVEGKRVPPEDHWSIRDRTLAGPPGNISWASYEGPMSSSTLIGKTIKGYKKARARVLDCFVKDDSYETVVEPETDSDGNYLRDQKGEYIYKESIKSKYPNGRRIIGANGVILFDGPNPNPRDDFGILRVVLEPTLGRFWSQGFVQQTAELQLAADKLMSSIVENAIRLNNGIIVAGTNTGVDWESFTGMPGQIVTINQGSQFDIKYPPPMPPDMVQAPWRMLDMQRRILGFQESRAGMASKGNVSAELTETEISQAQGPTRLRGRMLYYTVQRLAEMIFARMANGYLTPRVIPAVEGESFAPVTWNPLPNPEKYHIYIDPASFQVMSRTMLRRLGLALYKMRVVDRKSLLEVISWPDGEQVATRLDQADQQAAMAKARAKKS